MKSVITATAKFFLMAMMLQRLALAGPKLTMKESQFDFGYVPQASKISHDFWLYSTGDDTLKIVKISPG